MQNSIVEPTEVVQAEVIEQVTGEDIAMICVGGAAVVGITIVGGAIATNAVLLAMLTIGSAVVLWLKMPAHMQNIWGVRHLLSWLLPKAAAERALAFNWKNFAMRHELAIDVGVSVGAFFLYGATITGMVAAGLAGLGISVMLRLRKVFNVLLEKAQTFSGSLA